MKVVFLLYYFMNFYSVTQFIWALQYGSLDGFLLCMYGIEGSQYQSRELMGFFLLNEVLALFYSWDKKESLQWRKSRNVHDDKFGAWFHPSICSLAFDTVIKLSGFFHVVVK